MALVEDKGYYTTVVLIILTAVIPRMNRNWNCKFNWLTVVYTRSSTATAISAKSEKFTLRCASEKITAEDIGVYPPHSHAISYTYSVLWFPPPAPSHNHNIDHKWVWFRLHILIRLLLSSGLSLAIRIGYGQISTSNCKG